MKSKKKNKKKLHTFGKVEKTDSGFEIISFKDYYDKECSIQQSSLATESCIWLGMNETKPIILCKDAQKIGMIKDVANPVGWMDYPVPKEVFIPTRMHLTKKQVKALVTHLQAWLKNDSIGTE